MCHRSLTKICSQNVFFVELKGTQNSLQNKLHGNSLVSGHNSSDKVLLDNSLLESSLGWIELGATENNQVSRLDFFYFMMDHGFGKHFILKTVKKGGYLVIEDCYISRLVKI